jgi:hypothetical protein
VNNYLVTITDRCISTSYPQAYGHVCLRKTSQNNALGEIHTKLSFLILTKELI